MPQDPWLWAFAIFGGVVVIVVALILGGRVEVGFDPLSLKFRRKQESGNEKIAVLNDADIESSKVGAVTGEHRVVSNESDAAGGVTDIEVANRTKIKDSEIGDISGISVSGSSKSNDGEEQEGDASDTGNGRSG